MKFEPEKVVVETSILDLQPESVEEVDTGNLINFYIKFELKKKTFYSIKYKFQVEDYDSVYETVENESPIDDSSDAFTVNLNELLIINLKTSYFKVFYNLFLEL